MPRQQATGRYDTIEELTDVVFDRKFIGGATHGMIAKDEGISQMTVTRVLQNREPSKAIKDKIGIAFKKGLPPKAVLQVVKWVDTGFTYNQIQQIIGIEPELLEGLVTKHHARQEDRSFRRSEAQVKTANELAERQELNRLMDMFDAVCEEIEQNGVVGSEAKIMLYAQSYRDLVHQGRDIELLSSPAEFATYLPAGSQDQFRANIDQFLQTH